PGSSAGSGSGGRTASGPSDNRVLKPASSRIVTPTSTALSYLEPGLSPATTKPVFFDTDPVTLPPAARTASAASSRLSSGSDPVITTVTPASRRGLAPVGSKPSSSIRTPDARHLST